MDEKFKDTFEKAAAFQNMWMDSMAGMARVWSQYSPENPPPEELKKMRQGMLQVISQSWEEFMRTPQFMEMMKDSLNNAMTWQSFAKDGANRIHDTMQTPSKSDVDGILLSLRHVEKRLLDRMETLQEQVSGLESKIERVNGANTAADKSEAAFQKQTLDRLASIEKACSGLGASRATEPSAESAKKTTAAKAAVKKSAKKTKRES